MYRSKKTDILRFCQLLHSTNYVQSQKPTIATRYPDVVIMMDSRDQFVKSLFGESLLHTVKKLYKNNSVMRHTMEKCRKKYGKKIWKHHVGVSVSVLISTLLLLFCVVYCKINQFRHILIIINIESNPSRIQKHADNMSPLTLAPFCSPSS